jgi:hypothetical protein
VDKGSDEQLNKAPAMNGNESTGKRMDVPPLALGFNAPLDSKLHQILSSDAREKRERWSVRITALAQGSGNR